MIWVTVGTIHWRALAGLSILDFSYFKYFQNCLFPTFFFPTRSSNFILFFPFNFCWRECLWRKFGTKSDCFCREFGKKRSLFNSDPSIWFLIAIVTIPSENLLTRSDNYLGFGEKMFFLNSCPSSLHSSVFLSHCFFSALLTCSLALFCVLS